MTPYRTYNPVCNRCSHPTCVWMRSMQRPRRYDAMLIHRLQNSPLTRWMWRTWQHDETGRVVMLPFWKRPGRRWLPVNWRE